MLAGFPEVTVTTRAFKALTEEEGKTAEDAESFKIATRVVIDAHALMRIAKHAEDNRRQAQGKLTGMQFGSVIEVSMAVPEVPPPMEYNISPEEQAQKREEAEVKDRETLTELTACGLDGFVVGSYTTCTHSNLNDFHVRKLAEAMRDEPLRKGGRREKDKEARPALLLLYDPQRTAMGKLFLRALVPTEEYAAYSRTSGGTNEFVKSGISAAGIVRDVPIEIHVSPLAELVMRRVAGAERGVANFLVKRGDLAPYTERGVSQVAELQRDIRRSAEFGSRTREHGHDSLKTELQFVRLRDQVKHMTAVETGAAINIDFVRAAHGHFVAKQ
jgi:copper chaperone CopZ